MTLTYTYNGSSLTHKIAPTSLLLPQRAYRGNVNSGGCVIEDRDGTLTLTGLKSFVVEESDCAQPVLWRGWMTEREVGRMASDEMYTGSASRAYTAELYDLNALFMFRVISGTDGRRPEESLYDRMTWLLGSDYLTGLIEDTGYVVGSAIIDPVGMEAADYIGKYPLDVLNDMSDRTSDLFNYYAFWDTAGTAVGLFFNYFTTSIGTATLSISNDMADVDSDTVFAPFHDAVLRTTPEDTYSEVILEYANGRIFRSSSATETAYIRRGTTIQRPYTGKSTTADTQATNWLNAHGVEIDEITCTLRLPSSKVGLIRAGQAIVAKFTHLPNYSTNTTFIVSECNPVPINDWAQHYDVQLKLIYPRTSSGAGTIDDCSDDYPNTASGYYPPLNSEVTNADAVHYYTKPSIDPPYVPTPSFGGGWNFFGAGTGGSPDNGFGEQNRWRIMVIGPGTLTIHTQASTSAEWNYYIEASNGVDTYITNLGEETGLTPGDDAVVELGEAVGPYCIWVVTCHAGPTGKTNAAGVTWAALESVDVDLPPPLGTLVQSETPSGTPNGSTTLFTLDYGYLPGSLEVYVDNLNQTAAVTETSPTAGTFTLAFAPKTGEIVRATYRVGA